MAQSDLDGAEHNPKRKAGASPGWVRWVFAGVILLLLAFSGHTSGRLANQVRQQMQHWMTVNGVPFGLNQDASHLLAEISTLRSERSTHPAAVNGTSWRAPVDAARLTKSFGWHGSGAQAQFQPDVILDVTPHRTVLAGVQGHVLKTGRTIVELTAHEYHIAIFPLTPAGLAHGQAVQPATRLGVTRAATLTLEVTRRGYPVNPLSSSLYGSAWLKH
ncbi:MAG: hypothetical protein C7B45_08165 [Sulfobacillus acidophilus]|uniref:Uncharacterized protein n=1 Tax=Sulfobacillus acidophilus TaxID=53633 RepID=A0A2T2WIK7_9FIRM|nr:MAG: hypothetical protein C7B45_08165 [Sulfobacillus acidophilus]